MTVPRLPLPLQLVRDAGHQVFTEARSANLVVLRGRGAPDEWDGWCTLSYLPEAHSGWLTRSWPCATRPGTVYLRSPLNPSGTATIAPGQYRRTHHRGLHRGRKALVQIPGTVVRVLRDPNRDTVYEPLVADTGNALNIHDVGHPRMLAGCVGLATLHLEELLREVEAIEPYQGLELTLTLIGAP